MVDSQGHSSHFLESHSVDALVSCPVCNASMSSAFTAQILSCYDVTYYQCPACELLQTEQPYWLEEAYATAIVDSDIGLLQRNIEMATIVSNILFLHNKHGVYLDYAGGYGILCRLMRDIGFDYYATDAYCKNIFAQNFAWETMHAKDSVRLHGISAIEVLEHIHQPLQLFENMRSWLCPTSGMIFFTTLLYQGTTPPPPARLVVLCLSYRATYIILYDKNTCNYGRATWRVFFNKCA